MVSVENYVRRTTGIDIKQNEQTNNVHALVGQTKKLVQQMRSDLLGGYLYNAVVKMHNGKALQGQGLGKEGMQKIVNVARSAQIYSSSLESPEVTNVIKDFECAARRYSDFLSQENTHGNGKQVDASLKKNPIEALKKGTTMVPRHSLVRHDGEIYELMTWMSDGELKRVMSKSDGARTNGIYGMEATKSKDRKWAGITRVEHKYKLGEGGFGSASIARRVSDDQYLVIKKTHPRDWSGFCPQPLKQTMGVNDGSQKNVTRIHGSYLAKSTRSASRIAYVDSAYTLTELGVIDLQNLIQMCSLFSFALNKDFESHPKASELRADILLHGSNNDPQVSSSRLAKLDTNPLSSSDVSRRFRNTLAFQMLHAVQQMHSNNMAHNDIKPDNFVLALDTDQDGRVNLRVKLIDFDLSEPISDGIGKARQTYCSLFAAGQIHSNKRNNRPDKNDAYSLGVSFKLLNGESLDSIIRLHEKMKRNLMGVETQTKIENRWKLLPELATMAELADLMCHPHSAKRYSIDKAINSFVFKNPGNLMDDSEFTQVAATVIRQAEMLPPDVMKAMSFDRQLQFLRLESLGAAPGPAKQMGRCLRIQDTRFLLERYILENSIDGDTKVGEAKLLKALNMAKRAAVDEVIRAIPRRVAKAVNPRNWVKSSADMEADYKVKNRLPSVE